nr:hypothetical protein [Tanacetum cinerariifolium]
MMRVLSQKGNEVGRSVKEKQGSMADNCTGDASAAKEVISPSVVDKNVEKKKQRFLVDTTGLGSSPSLPTKEITMASNASGKSLYANVIGESRILRNPDVDLLKEDVGNVPVWLKLHGVPITAFDEDGLSALLRYLADVELKDTIVMAMPKIIREGYYTCTVHVENEWKPRRCSCCKVFGHTQEECPKNIRLSVAKNLKKPSQTSRGVLVGLKVGLNLIKNINLFLKSILLALAVIRRKTWNLLMRLVIQIHLMFLIWLIMIWSLVPIGGTTNLVNNEANSSGSSFMNVKNSSTSTTIIGKSEKFKDLLISGKSILVNDTGNTLKNVKCSGDYDSENEVASVDNDMAHSMASKKSGSSSRAWTEPKGVPRMPGTPMDLLDVKENQEKDKIGLKPNKNRKRGEAGRSLKQLHLKEEEKTKKTKKEWPKTHARIKSY